MPLTLPTHPVAVVPLKLWRPRWFDGVALTIGAIAPDVTYAAVGYGPTIAGHAWHAPLWWAVPLTLIGAPLIRWAAPTVAAHLPSGGPLALRDYGVLGEVRHRWYVVAASAMIGAISHIVWDAATHPAVHGGHVIFPALHREVWSGLPWWAALSNASDVAGFVAGAVLAGHLGRARLLRRWHGPPPAAQTRPVPFWCTAALVLAIGLLLLPFQPVRVFPAQAVRGMLVVGLALLCGAAAVRLRTARSTGTR